MVRAAVQSSKQRLGGKPVRTGRLPGGQPALAGQELHRQARRLRHVAGATGARLLEHPRGDVLRAGPEQPHADAEALFEGVGDGVGEVGVERGVQLQPALGAGQVRQHTLALARVQALHPFGDRREAAVGRFVVAARRGRAASGGECEAARQHPERREADTHRRDTTSVVRALKAGAGAGIVLAAAWLALVPAGYLVWGALTDDDSLTLDHLTRAFGADLVGEMAWNSTWFALGTTLVTVPLGTALAFLVVRTDLPLRRTIFALTMVPLLVPGAVSTIGWILVASPRTGLVNAVLGSGTVDIFSPAGMVLAEAAQSLPLVFLLMAGAFATADGTLEEAAVVSGARPLSVLRRVTLPLALPALAASALVVAVRTLESFEVPALLGLPDGIWVFTSRIWRALERLPADYGQAGAYALALVVVIALGVWFYRRIARRAGGLTGGARPRRLALGTWRAPLGALALGTVATLVVLPLAMVVYTSLQPRFAAPSLDGLSQLGLDAYGAVARDGASITALGNSLLLAAGSATVAALLTICIAWLAVRAKVRGSGGLDVLVSLPLAIPGLVLGTALLFVYLRAPLPVYGTLWILLIAYVTQALPYGMRFSAAALAQVGAELDEAARVSGADGWQRARRVLLPLVLPGLVAGWLYLAISAMRDLAASVVVAGPETRVIAVRIFEQYESGELPEMAALAVMELAVVAVLAVAGVVALRRFAPRLARLGQMT